MAASSAHPSGNQPPAGFMATRLESDEDIRAALQARRARRGAQASPTAKTAGPKEAQAKPAASEVEAKLERPVLRPPVGMLCICDDGKQEGEWLRLRGDRSVIGRSEGDVRITHDTLMSARHAEIVRKSGKGGFRWYLVDLQSTNGTFVRIGSSPLWHGCELMIGAGRYRFAAGVAATGPAQTGDVHEVSTRAWADDSLRALVPSLVEVTPSGPLQRYPLTLPEYWLGQDPSCAIARVHDPYVSGRHARLYRDAKSQWHVENNKSLNGVWLRVTEPMPLADACRFRLGEQRFVFRVGS